MRKKFGEEQRQRGFQWIVGYVNIVLIHTHILRTRQTASILNRQFGFELQQVKWTPERCAQRWFPRRMRHMCHERKSPVRSREKINNQTRILIFHRPKYYATKTHLMKRNTLFKPSAKLVKTLQIPVRTPTKSHLKRENDVWESFFLKNILSVSKKSLPLQPRFRPSGWGMLAICLRLAYSSIG